MITRSKGTTIIEFLIYIAIVGIILTVAGAIFFNVIFGKAKLGAIEEVSQNGRLSIEKMVNIMRNAEAINSP